MSQNFGIGQIGMTCWFNSSLNTFLLSENGQKILWDKLQNLYSKFSQRDKAYFDSDINAPCPIRKDIKKTSMVYFWKFLDQFLCSRGPGKLGLHPGKEQKLMRNVNIVEGSTVKRAEKGAFPSKEIDVILKHIGFTSGDYNIVDYSTPFNNRKKFAICVEDTNVVKRIPVYDLPLKEGKFELSSAVLFINNTQGVGEHRAHDVACVKRGARGYIVDSNLPHKLWPCEWWTTVKLQDFLKTSKLFDIYSNFKNGKIDSYGFEFLVYTNTTFTDKISPSCKRVGKVVGKPAYKQAQIIRMVENIVNKANSKFDAMNKFNALKSAGYLDNSNKVTFQYFLNKRKFPMNLKSPTRKGSVSGNMVFSPLNENKNKKGRPILKGPKGGLYVIGAHGKKIYKKLVPSSGANNKGRTVRTGKKGARYVIHEGKKLYKFFH